MFPISIDRNVVRENVVWSKAFNRLTFKEDSFFFLIVLAKQSRKHIAYYLCNPSIPLLHRGCSVMHGRDKTSERDGTMLAVPVLFLKYDKTGRFDS